MILHQVESLAAAGVTDIVLAVNYRPDVMVSTLKKVRSIRRENESIQAYADGHLREFSMRNNIMSKSNSPSSPNPWAPRGP